MRVSIKVALVLAAVVLVRHSLPERFRYPRVAASLQRPSAAGNPGVWVELPGCEISTYASEYYTTWLGIRIGQKCHAHNFAVATFDSGGGVVQFIMPGDEVEHKRYKMIFWNQSPQQ